MLFLVLSQSTAASGVTVTQWHLKTSQNIEGFLMPLSQCICTIKYCIVDMYYTAKSNLLRGGVRLIFQATISLILKTQVLADELFSLGPVNNLLETSRSTLATNRYIPATTLQRLWPPSRTSEYCDSEFCMRTAHIYVRKCKDLENRYNNTHKI